MTPVFYNKNRVPAFGTDKVSRPRLVQLLSDGFKAQKKLMVLFAPSGYGKTTSIAEWIQKSNPSPDSNVNFSYLNLDTYDNSFDQFVSLLLKAITDGDRGIKYDLSPLSVLNALFCNLKTKGKYNAVILDNFQNITEGGILCFMRSFIDQLPENAAIVISTRLKIPFSLSSLRANRQILEIPPDSLLFTSHEIERWMNLRLGRGYPPEELDRLCDSSLGWVILLELAFSNWKDGGKSRLLSEYIKVQNPYIRDFFRHEILSGLPESIEDFFVQTSILQPLDEKACDHLLKIKHSARILDELAHTYSIISPREMDSKEFDVHPLLTKILQELYLQKFPGQAGVHHRRLSQWYAEQNDLAKAIDHAFLAGDMAWAEALLEKVNLNSIGKLGLSNLSGWFYRLPRTNMQRNLRLSMTFAWIQLLFSNLVQASEIVDAIDPCEVESEKYSSLKAEWIALKAVLAMKRGEGEKVNMYSRELMEIPITDDLTLKSVKNIVLASALRRAGDSKQSLEAVQNALSTSVIEKYPLLIFSNLYDLANNHFFWGRYNQAQLVLEKCLQEMENLPLDPILQGLIYILFGQLILEQNKVESAKSYISQGIKLVEKSELNVCHVIGHLALARVGLAEKRFEEAGNAIRTADHIAQKLGMKGLLKDVSYLTALWDLRSGNLAEASRWADDFVQRESGYNADPSSYPVFLVAAIWMAEQGDIEDRQKIIAFLEKWLQVALRADWVIGVARASLLLSILYHRNNQLDLAVLHIQRALILSAREGYYRLFVDEGLPAQKILLFAREKGVLDEFVTQVLKAFRTKTEQATFDVSRGEKSSSRLKGSRLTKQELNILFLISQGESNQGIAEKLFISKNTVKRHITNIMTKLDASSRREAVRCAREAGILKY